MASLLEANEVPYVDANFEFDAPQYFDFQTMAPASPSDTDIWFDTSGPKGLASPEKTNRRPSVNKIEDSGISAEATSSGQGLPASSEEKIVEEMGMGDTAAEEVQPGVAVPVTHSPLIAPSREQKRGQACGAPSNLVTAWGPHGAATRVIVVPMGQNEEAAEAPAAEGVSLPVRKRTGFIAGRPSLRSQACAAKRQEPGDPASAPAAEKPSTGAAISKTMKGNKKQRVMPPSVQDPASSTSQGGFVAGQAGLLRSGVQTRSQTRAGAPKLATSARPRKPRCKSREELEAEEMAAMPKFKARPFNPKLGGLPANNRLSLASTASRRTMNDESAAPFRARAVDSRILQGPTFMPQLVRQETAESVAPKFATDARLRGQPEQQAPDFVFKAVSGQPRQRTRASSRRDGLTVPKPFNLATDARSQVSNRCGAPAEKESSEAEAPKKGVKREGLAPESMPLPVLTMPEPFNLESEKRHEEAQVLREMLKQQELERQREQTKFKALPLPRSKPFVPTKSDRLLTVPEAVELPGEKRRLQRAEFDAAKAERDLKQQEEKAAAEAEQRLREEQEIRQLRKAQEFKARPMPQYRSVLKDVQLPPLQWTDPVSPQLATEARAVARSKHELQ